MTISNTILVFMSVILLVVVQLSNICRDIDLTRVANRNSGYYFGHANLGTFVALHSLNFFILMMTVIFVILSLSSSLDPLRANVHVFLVLFSVILWFLVPLIEVSEYDDILGKGRHPRSLLVYVISNYGGSILIAILLDNGEVLFSVIVFFIMYFGSVIFYSYLLREELEKMYVCSDSIWRKLQSYFQSIYGYYFNLWLLL